MNASESFIIDSYFEIGPDETREGHGPRSHSAPTTPEPAVEIDKPPALPPKDRDGGKARGSSHLRGIRGLFRSKSERQAKREKAPSPTERVIVNNFRTKRHPEEEADYRTIMTPLSMILAQGGKMDVSADAQADENAVAVDANSADDETGTTTDKLAVSSVTVHHMTSSHATAPSQTPSPFHATYPRGHLLRNTTDPQVDHTLPKLTRSRTLGSTECRAQSPPARSHRLERSKSERRIDAADRPPTPIPTMLSTLVHRPRDAAKRRDDNHATENVPIAAPSPGAPRPLPRGQRRPSALQEVQSTDLSRESNIMSPPSQDGPQSRRKPSIPVGSLLGLDPWSFETPLSPKSPKTPTSSRKESHSSRSMPRKSSTSSISSSMSRRPSHPRGNESPSAVTLPREKSSPSPLSPIARKPSQTSRNNSSPSAGPLPSMASSPSRTPSLRRPVPIQPTSHRLEQVEDGETPTLSSSPSQSSSPNAQFATEPFIRVKCYDDGPSSKHVVSCKLGLSQIQQLFDNEGAIASEDTSVFADLLNRIHGKFGITSKQHSTFSLCYQDDDGDRIGVRSDEDLRAALEVVHDPSRIVFWLKKSV